MAWNRRSILIAILTVLAFLPSFLLNAQQPNLQTSLLAPAAVRLASAGAIADIKETEHLPYLTEIAKKATPGAIAFQPSPSDLLIQQAEERFRNGKRSYQELDFKRARQEFDGAIDLMLQASANPTDRKLFESKFEDMVDAIHRDDLSGMGSAAVDEVPGFDKAPLDDIISSIFPVDPQIKARVQTEVKLTSSALPLVVNDVVLGYINYFNGRGRKTIETGLARAGKYQAMISRVLAEEGVPQELIHLAQAESGFLPRAVSRAAAEGVWQFVKFRGNQYGLMQTSSSDERLDPEKATRAAARHLHDLFNEFGDWYLAMAAYNCGPGVIERAVERTGYADFWELRSRHVLPNETSNYVPIILAMTIMAKNAQAYGLDQVVPEAPVEYDTIVTAAPTNLALIGDLTDTPVSQLLQLNPALLRSIAPANFEIRVPRGYGGQVASALELVPAQRRASWRIHRVEPGETLSSIARRFNSSSTVIANANSLPAGEPSEGEQLVIPAVYHEAAPPLRAPAAAKAPVRKAQPARSRAVAAKPVSHRTAGTLAQIKEHTRVISR
jgi:membrane-bound lytic murein transglycosylase D